MARIPTKCVCSGCINEFTTKEIFIAPKPNSEYNTYYCLDCIKKLEIVDAVPYLKPRKKSKKEKPS